MKKEDYPLHKFVLEHSDEYPDGKTLVMKIGETKPGSWHPIEVITFDVQPNENFFITTSVNWRSPYLGELTNGERHLCFIQLFKLGVTDERQ